MNLRGNLSLKGFPQQQMQASPPLLWDGLQARCPGSGVQQGIGPEGPPTTADAGIATASVGGPSGPMPWLRNSVSQRPCKASTDSPRQGLAVREQRREIDALEQAWFTEAFALDEVDAGFARGKQC